VRALTSTDVLRPGPGGVKAALTRQVTALIPFGMGLLRRFKPIFAMGGNYVVTRYDDVREVFGTDAAFGVVYNDNIQVLTGGEPFFLGMPDSSIYHAQLDAMRRVVKPSDLPALGDKAEALAEAFVAASGGQVEVVSLVRQVTILERAWPSWLSGGNAGKQPGSPRSRDEDRPGARRHLGHHARFARDRADRRRTCVRPQSHDCCSRQ
jgi:hypothetical protein